MEWLKSCPLALLLAGMLAAPGAIASEAEAEIRGIVAAQATAWNDGNCKEFARRVAVDAGFTTGFGTISFGSAAFESWHCEMLASHYKNTLRTHAIQRVRFITPDIAVVDIASEIHGIRTAPAGLKVPAGGMLRAALMELFVRRDGQWWIEAYHDTDIKVPKPQSAQTLEP